jgi:hypothetical protein
MGAERNAYRILLRKPGGKRPLGRPRCMWVDNINMFLEGRMLGLAFEIPEVKSV